MFPTAATNKPSASQSFRNLKSSKPQLNTSKSTIDDTNSINSASNANKPADANSSSSNLSNKLAYSFNRTATLPKRFKEKFLNKSTIINQAPSSNKNTLYSSASVDSQTSSISSTSTSSSSSASSSNTSTNSSSPLKHALNTNPISSNPYLFKYKEQLSNLNKYVENFLKSIKYLEQIIKKKKFEIVSNSATAILESILDVYNLIQSFDPHNAILSKRDDASSKSTSVSKAEFNYHKSRINLCLANLIKWSDGILYSFNFNTSDFVNSWSGNELDKSLTSDLIKSINEFVEFFHKRYFNSIETGETKPNEHKPNQLERSSSLIDCNKSDSLSASSSISSSSSIKLNSNDKTSPQKANSTKPKSATSLSSISGYAASIHNPNIASDANALTTTTTTTTTIEDKDGMKSIKTTVNKSKAISANTYVTQTTILTTSSNKFNQDNITTTTSISMNDTMFDAASSANVSINLFNHSKLSAFSDLDRLALELSELSSLPSSSFLVNNVTKSLVESDQAQAQAKETPKQIKSKTFTNEQCGYLLSQFETFAKQFSRNEPDFSSSCQSPSKGNSAYSTLDRSEMNRLGNAKSMFAFDSPLKSINSISSPHPKRTTLHVNSSFKHDLEQKHTVVDSVNAIKSDGHEIDVVLNKLSDVKQRTKTSFIEKNLCIDERVAEKILGRPARVEPEQDLDEAEDDDKKIENDPVKNYMSFLENEKNTLKRNETTSDCNTSNNNNQSVHLEKLISAQVKRPFRVNLAAKDNDNTDIDSVDEENDDDCNGSYLIFGANNLNPNFLLIDDDGDDDAVSNETARKITNNNSAKGNFFDDFCDKYASHSVPYLDDLDDEMNDYNDVIKIKNEDKASNANCDFEFEMADLSADITTNKDSISATPINIQNESSFELVSSNLPNVNSLSSLTNSSLSLPIESKSNLNEDDQSINSNNFSINKQNLSNNDMILQSNVVQSQPSLVSSFRLSNSSELSAVSSQHTDFKSKIDPSVLLTPISLLKTGSVDTDVSNENKPTAISLNTESRDVLSLLDVNHLLEYQSQSQLVSTSSLSANFLLNNSNPTHNPSSNTSILRGGHIDALIVLATSPNSSVIAATHSINNNVKANSTSSISSSHNTSFTNGKDNKGNFLYQEAFLTTYRTLLEPIELIDKLIYRYRLFSKYKSKKYNFNANHISKSNLGEHIDHDEKFDINRLKMNIKYNKMAASAARNSLSLLIRVIDDLG